MTRLVLIAVCGLPFAAAWLFFFNPQWLPEPTAHHGTLLADPIPVGALALRALDGFRGDASFRTWMMTITANEARATLRRRGRWSEAPIDDVAPIASDDPNPAEQAVSGNESARARALLETLPEKQRLSVSLRIDDGLSFREIGEMIGSSEGAARVNYFHGIRRLRELMQ